MEALLILAALGAYVLTSAAKVKKNWRPAVDARFMYSGPLFPGDLTRVDHRGFDVVIDRVTHDNQPKVRATINGVDPGFTLGPDSALQRMIKPDIETGDQIFDERTRIEGDADWALALLGEDARRLAEIAISGWNGELKDGVLVALFDNVAAAPSSLDSLLDLAEMLRRPADRDLPKLLKERACHDPSTSVRLQAFRRLTLGSKTKREALEAAEVLLDSLSDVLTLEACRLLVTSSPEQSDRAAEELRTLAAGEWNDTSVRRTAIETLVDSRHRATALATIDEILKDLDAPEVVRRTALEGLIEAEAKDELLVVQVDGEAEAEILARGLGRFDVSVQPRLLQLLEVSGGWVRTEAAKSLGQVGDLDAILALRRIADQAGLFRSSEAREAEYAITEIKSRAGGSQQGEISITTVAPLEGAISPSDDSEAGGEVSLTSRAADVEVAPER